MMLGGAGATYYLTLSVPLRLAQIWAILSVGRNCLKLYVLHLIKNACGII